MSIESLEAFGREVQINSGLHEKLMIAQARATAEVGTEAGYSFTVEEARTLIDKASAELSDEQLEAVAGGLVGLSFPIKADRPR